MTLSEIKDPKLRERIEQQIRIEDRRASPRPELEPAVCHEPVAAEARETGDAGRIHVRVVSYRKRLIDPDNLCPKYFVDCVRYSGLIPNDTPDKITLEVTQERSQNERTEITLTHPTP